MMSVLVLEDIVLKLKLGCGCKACWFADIPGSLPKERTGFTPFCCAKAEDAWSISSTMDETLPVQVPLGGRVASRVKAYDQRNQAFQLIPT